MPPKIFTSRYSNPELAGDKYTVVGVTRTPPKFPLRYQLQGNIAEIAPPGWLFSETNVERFRTPYFRYLDKTGPFQIKRILENYLSYGKDVVLCCYEDVRVPGEWCHRTVFAAWWKLQTGQEICELFNSQEPKLPAAVQKRIKAEQEAAERAKQPEQLSFF